MSLNKPIIKVGNNQVINRKKVFDFNGSEHSLYSIRNSLAMVIIIPENLDFSRLQKMIEVVCKKLKI